MNNYISKKTIRFWLENYEALSLGDHPEDYVPGHTGPKEYDNVYMSQLNKIMLDKAIESLPLKVKTCVRNRWIRKVIARETCDVLGITRDEYYVLCSEGIQSIYEELNGEMIGVKKLLQRIK